MALTEKKKKIAVLAASRMTQAQIAAACGCTESYISQVLAEEEVKELVQKERVAVDAHTPLVQRKYDNVEHKILKAIDDAVPFAELRDLTRALEVVAKHNPRSRGQMMEALKDNGNKQVVVQLPPFIQQNLTVQHNARNEIVQVGDRSMQGLTVSEFKSKLPVLKQQEVSHDDSKS